MNNINYFKDQFEQLQESNPDGAIADLRKDGFKSFSEAGIPSLRHEEWKYTNVSSLFEKEYHLAENTTIGLPDIDAVRLPGYEQANELVFVNGIFVPELSVIRSKSTELVVLPLEDAAKGIYKDIIYKHLNNSHNYINDGIHALNTSFICGGVFIHVLKGKEPEHPVYFYHILDTRRHPALAQPRSLVYADQSSKLQLTESYTTIGTSDSFNNEVMEIVVKENAVVEYYKIQNDGVNASQVNTTHISQIGRSYVHAVTVTLSGSIVRNNMNLVLDALGNETHLYGLYLLKGKTHADNHTLIDNLQPNCFSNQLYKGIADDSSTAVFNGRIMVQPDAQKTNAYQSNRNILLSDQATINAKPQLEIFADDVKCSHGCTIGQLDSEALFYLRARGVPKETAAVLLLQAFAADIITQIKIEPLRKHVENLIYKHLSI